ncbi:MAG: hydantoinase/oxoprolinase family protein [Bacillota bacterium]|nr:hydantoinase/oxoprolinase family protein [Bacillota bacterium]
MSRYRVAVDIGGTFTDMLVFDQESGAIRLYKVPSTPARPQDAVLAALDKAGLDMREVEFFGHGCTVAINTLLQRKGARTGLITTRGFRDVLEIQRFNRPDMYNLYYRKPGPLVPRYLRLEVNERVLWDGSVRQPLDLEEVDAAMRQLLAEGVEAVAICFINSYVNPEHELRALEFIRQRYPQVYSQASVNLSREWREYERSSTAVMAAYLMPSVRDYLSGLDLQLRERGYVGQVLVTKSDGGLMAVPAAQERPTSMLASGTAAAVLGAQYFSAITNNPNVITLDMGGTSADVCLVEGGKPNMVTSLEVERYPVLEPFIDIYSISAGGGTKVWVQNGSLLKVGPHSAGADPGPACYGRGGTEPTITDANLLLGRIDPHYFLGGEMVLDVDRARTAFQRVAAQVGMTVEECALGAIRIVNASMVDAIRAVSVQRGYDPRDFTLLAFGGAGPLHGAALAEDLGIPRVIVPQNPSHMSPWGILVADMKHSYAQTYTAPVQGLDPAEVNKLFTEMMEAGRRQLRDERVAEEQIYFQAALDMRYAGQEHTVTVPCQPRIDDSEKQFVVQRFHTLHQQLYAFSMPEDPCEVVAVRITAYGRMPTPQLPSLAVATTDVSAARKGHRQVYLEGAGWTSCPVYDRTRLQPGHRFTGPAIVEEPTSTTLVNPGQRAEVDAYGSLVIHVAA